MYNRRPWSVFNSYFRVICGTLANSVRHALVLSKFGLLDPSKFPALSQSDCYTQRQTGAAVYRSRTGAPLGGHITFMSCNILLGSYWNLRVLNLTIFSNFPENSLKTTKKSVKATKPWNQIPGKYRLFSREIK